MTFDTSYDEPPQRSHSAFDLLDNSSHDPQPTRPELRSSMTMPNNVGASAVGALAMEPNAWDDHGFGHEEEGEIQMSFE